MSFLVCSQKQVTSAPDNNAGKIGLQVSSFYQTVTVRGDGWNRPGIWTWAAMQSGEWHVAQTWSSGCLGASEVSFFPRSNPRRVSYSEINKTTEHPVWEIKKLGCSLHRFYPAWCWCWRIFLLVFRWLSLDNQKVARKGISIFSKKNNW